MPDIPGVEPVDAARASLQQRLCRYYLDCLARDLNTELSCWARPFANAEEYVQIAQIPLDPDAYQRIAADSAVIALLRRMELQRTGKMLQLGYPTHLHKFRSKRGNDVYRVQPLLMTEFRLGPNDDQSESGLGGYPDINPAAIKDLVDFREPEVLREITELTDELGFDGEDEEFPSVGDVARRLRQARPDWPWREDPDSERLSSRELRVENVPGIYNVAAVFLTDRPRYTVGLERELADLTKDTLCSAAGTALENWISAAGLDNPGRDVSLVEAVPLNQEQYLAVQKSLTAPLTVITGPPGTGKS